VIFGEKGRSIVSQMSAAPQSGPVSSLRDEIGEYIQGLSSQLEIQARRSEAPGALLWSLIGSLPSAQGEISGRAKFPLGSPKSYLRYFSLVRVWSPWLAPRHGEKEFRLTEDAILCSFLRSDGLNLVLLAVSGVNDVLTVFGSGENGEIVVDARNDSTDAAQFQILASVGESFDVCVSSLVYEARKVVRDSATTVTLPVVSDLPPEPESPVNDDSLVIIENDPRTQWLADWYEGLSYCTWNSLGQDLTEERILDALDSLKRHGINVVNLIIDDNWQSLDNDSGKQWNRGWKRFQANEKGFPAGLGHTAATIRQRHPNIEHIAVWHALMGYWGGISPEGDLAKSYKTKEVARKDLVAGGPMLAIDPDDINRFYDDFYSFLTSSGIDAVKTDAQFYLDLLDSAEDRRRFISSYQDAWTIASLRYFSTRAISCMSMTPQHIFHSQIPTNKPSILLRNSDDFFPDVADSHPWHVFCNAHNSLLTSHLNVIPDWDMFQTSHPYAAFHAAARCVSGGPIYITDKPGEHDIDLINQITAPTTRESTVILRPSVMGRTLDIYHNYNEGNILRIGTYSGWAHTGSGILGVFNINPGDISSIVPLTAFPGVDTTTSSFGASTHGNNSSYEHYIIRSHRTRIISEIMKPNGAHSLVSVSLPPKGWDVLTAYPLRAFTLEGSRGCSSRSSSVESLLTHVAVLGLLGKMTGIAAVVNSDVSVVESGRLKFDVNLKALGILGIYHSKLESRDVDTHVMVLISGIAVPRRTVWKDGDNVLAVDVLQAWKELGLDAGWSNEVRVQVFIS
jgi:Raffinose synthase or seed imbibition protein Sip1